MGTADGGCAVFANKVGRPRRESAERMNVRQAASPPLFSELKRPVFQLDKKVSVMIEFRPDTVT